MELGRLRGLCTVECEQGDVGSKLKFLPNPLSCSYCNIKVITSEQVLSERETLSMRLCRPDWDPYASGGVGAPDAVVTNLAGIVAQAQIAVLCLAVILHVFSIIPSVLTGMP